MAVRRPTAQLAIGPSPLAIAYDVSRAARWWAGSPGRIATVTQWGGPGPAMSMPDGSPTVSTRGVRRCARRAQHLAASAGLARGAGSPAARGRDATGTPGRARPLTTNHHHSDDPVPLCCHRRELARSSWGPARQSGRPGPTIIRADQVGPRMPLASAAAAPQPDPPRLTRPLARSPRHTVPATSLAGDSDAPGPPVPGGPAGPHRRLGRTSRRHGPPGTGRPRSSWDSDARDHRPPAPRHQVATHEQIVAVASRACGLPAHYPSCQHIRIWNCKTPALSFAAAFNLAASFAPSSFVFSDASPKLCYFI